MPKHAPRVVRKPSIYTIQCNEGVTYAVILAYSPDQALKKFEHVQRLSAAADLALGALLAVRTDMNENGVALVR